MKIIILPSQTREEWEKTHAKDMEHDRFIFGYIREGWMGDMNGDGLYGYDIDAGGYITNARKELEK